jgi:tRNA (Thr-GGU) A37 N-methylase
VRAIDPPSREGYYGATIGTRLKIGPIETFDGTPVVDIKSASTRADG